MVYQIPKEYLIPKNAPLHLGNPTDREKEATRSLKEFIEEVAPLDSKEGRNKRFELLADLETLVNEWVKDVCRKQNLDENIEGVGKLFVSGSYRLGVNQKGDDIDTICVVPNYVTQKDFFDETDGLVARLRARHEVSHILPISGARVPILEVVWNEVELDVAFARLTTTTIPKAPDDLLDDMILKGTDIGTMISLNGPRVTELLLKFVGPQKMEKFTLVLRLVRYWAKRRAVYSNKAGYLGGVNFSILVVFIMQLYPEATASVLLRRFFLYLSLWSWPSPIELCSQHQTPGIEGENFRQWNPKENARAKMPIITPAFPCSDSSYNVTSSTFAVMMREFRRGAEEVGKVLDSNKSLDENSTISAKDWEKLFEKTDFFHKYGVYLVLEASAGNEKDLKKWTGWVESRIRKFIEQLEHLPLSEICYYPKPFRGDVDQGGVAQLQVKEDRLEDDGVTSTDVSKLATSAENIDGGVVNSNNNNSSSIGEQVPVVAESGNVSLPTVRWFMGIKISAAEMQASGYRPNDLVNEVSQFIKQITAQYEEKNPTEMTPEMKAAIRVEKFKDLVKNYPSLYPEGADVAIKHHKELLQKVKAKIETAIETPVTTTSASTEISTNQSTIVDLVKDNNNAIVAPTNIIRDGLFDLPGIPWSTEVLKRRGIVPNPIPSSSSTIPIGGTSTSLGNNVILNATTIVGGKRRAVGVLLRPHQKIKINLLGDSIPIEKNDINNASRIMEE